MHREFFFLSFDELLVKEDVVYDKHTGKIFGFMNWGSVSNDLTKVKQSTQSQQKSINVTEVATHMLVLIVRGI